MRITALRLDEFGVGRYRITNPMTELEKRGHTTRIIQAEPNLRMRNDWFNGDILILQRQGCRDIFRLVNDIPPPNRPMVVYEIDDLLWDDPFPKQGLEIAKEWQRTIPPMIRGADAVICSTPELASKCAHLNPNSYVVRNGIDFDIRDWSKSINRPPEMKGKVVIGWSGSGWHEGDFDVIGKSLRAVMLKYTEVFLCLQGDAPNIAIWVQKLNIPKKRMCIIDWMPLDEHPSVYSLFDIGIAPLANTAYNRCKSELKLMELGARSLPYVASNVSPYRRFSNLSGGRCGLLASNEVDWFNSLEYLILQQSVRSVMGEYGLKFVSCSYSLEQQANDLEWSLKDILKRRN